MPVASENFFAAASSIGAPGPSAPAIHLIVAPLRSVRRPCGTTIVLPASVAGAAVAASPPAAAAVGASAAGAAVGASAAGAAVGALAAGAAVGAAAAGAAVAAPPDAGACVGV